MSKKFRSPILDITKDSVVMTPALFEHITEKNRLGYSEQEIIGAIQRYGQQFEALIASYHSDKGFHATRTINDLMSQWPQLLPRVAKDVLLALYDFRSNKTGGCFPGERAIAEKAGYSVRQVNRGKKELLRMGVIRWTRRYNGSNVYELDDASLACALVIGKILDQIKQEQDTLRREEMEGPAFGIDIMAMAIDNTADGIAMMAIPSGHEGSLTSNRTSKETRPLNHMDAAPHSQNGEGVDVFRNKERYIPKAAEVEAIYNAYPKKVGRNEALKSIGEALVALHAEHGDQAFRFLLEQTRRFAKSPMGGRGQYTPYPAKWFAAGRYHDDPNEWYRVQTPEQTNIQQAQYVQRPRGRTVQR